MSLPEPYYADESCTVYHADCRDVLPHLEVDVDMVLTDPPYAVSTPGVNHTHPPGKGTRNLDFFAGDGDWEAMTALAVEGVVRAASLCPTGSMYAWCGHRQYGRVVDALEGAGWSTRPVVWAKKCPIPAPPGSGWNSGAELCVYAYRPGRTWNHRPGEGPRSNVLTFDSYRHGQPGKVDHPTQKPLGLFVTLIEASSPVGGLVLDPFMGSGTTLRAALDTGRRAIGIELEERYCAIAVKRLAQGAFDFGGAA